jgi:acyl carrier protein
LYFRRKVIKVVKPRKAKTPVKKVTEDLLSREIKIEREIIFKRISEIIVDKLGCEESEVKEKASFRDDLGADSLDAVELLMDFEREFKTAIPNEVAEKVITVKDAVDLLYRLINTK